MAAVAVDTGVLIGFADSDDRHHDAAAGIVHGVDGGDLPTGLVTNYVVLETLNWIHSRHRSQVAVETYRRLHESAGFEIRHAAQKDFDRAVELFERYEGLAFGDATLVATMEREGVEYCYSFDADFDAVEGVTRLATAEDPFD